jgi:hypothetical protein
VATDLDQYLLQPSGERIAAALRDLLRQPSLTPVAVVATLWPPYWDELTRELREGLVTSAGVVYEYGSA